MAGALLLQGCSYTSWFAVSNSTMGSIVVTIAFSEESRTWTAFGKTVTTDCPLTARHHEPRSAPIRWLERDKTAKPWKWRLHDWESVDLSTCTALIMVPPDGAVAVWTVTNYARGRHVRGGQFPDLLAISNGQGRIVHVGSDIHRGFIERGPQLYVMPFGASQIEAGDDQSTEFDAFPTGDQLRSDQ